MRERLFAVIHLTVDAEDAFAGAAIRAFAVNYRLLPVALVRRGGGATAKQLIDDQLQVGDRLVGIVGLEDVELLFRRQPAA